MYVIELGGHVKYAGDEVSSHHLEGFERWEDAIETIREQFSELDPENDKAWIYWIDDTSSYVVWHFTGRKYAGPIEYDEPIPQGRLHGDKISLFDKRMKER